MVQARRAEFTRHQLALGALQRRAIEPLKLLDETKEITTRDLLINTVENYGVCQDNSIKSKSLQNLLREYDAIFNGTTETALSAPKNNYSRQVAPLPGTATKL